MSATQIVWLVWKEHTWDEDELHGVFSSEVAAKEFIAEKSNFHRFAIDEWSLDKPKTERSA